MTDRAAERSMKVIGSDSVDIPAGIEVSPPADPRVVLAIIAAYEELWPEPAEPPTRAVVGEWRFSGRWWRAIGHGSAMPPRLP